MTSSNPGDGGYNPEEDQSRYLPDEDRNLDYRPDIEDWSSKSDWKEQDNDPDGERLDGFQIHNYQEESNEVEYLSNYEICQQIAQSIDEKRDKIIRLQKEIEEEEDCLHDYFHRMIDDDGGWDDKLMGHYTKEEIISKGLEAQILEQEFSYLDYDEYVKNREIAEAKAKQKQDQENQKKLMVINDVGREYALWDGDPESTMYMKYKDIIPGWFEWSDLEVRDREEKVKMILLRIQNIKMKIEQEGRSVDGFLWNITPLVTGEIPF